MLKPAQEKRTTLNVAVSLETGLVLNFTFLTNISFVFKMIGDDLNLCMTNKKGYLRLSNPD